MQELEFVPDDSDSTSLVLRASGPYGVAARYRLEITEAGDECGEFLVLPGIRPDRVDLVEGVAQPVGFLSPLTRVRAALLQQVDSRDPPGPGGVVRGTRPGDRLPAETVEGVALVVGADEP